MRTARYCSLAVCVLTALGLPLSGSAQPAANPRLQLSAAVALGVPVGDLADEEHADANPGFGFEGGVDFPVGGSRCWRMGGLFTYHRFGFDLSYYEPGIDTGAHWRMLTLEARIKRLIFQEGAQSGGFVFGGFGLGHARSKAEASGKGLEQEATLTVDPAAILCLGGGWQSRTVFVEGSFKQLFTEGNDAEYKDPEEQGTGTFSFDSQWFEFRVGYLLDL